MSPLSAPGAHRLFPVDPSPTDRFEIIANDASVVARTGDLAVATIAAAASARRHHQPAWLVAPDRWTARLTPTADGWDVITDGPTPAPIDAIRRVLTHLPPEEQP